jgi:hypothetical protein
MDKTEILDKLIEDGNGYLITSQATNKGISKWYLAEYIKKIWKKWHKVSICQRKRGWMNFICLACEIAKYIFRNRQHYIFMDCWRGNHDMIIQKGNSSQCI